MPWEYENLMVLCVRCFESIGTHAAKVVEAASGALMFLANFMFIASRHARIAIKRACSWLQRRVRIPGAASASVITSKFASAILAAGGQCVLYVPRC
jgi:hypothetical protein